MNGPDNPQNTFAPMKAQKASPTRETNVAAAGAQPAKKKQKKASNKRKDG